MSRVKIKFVTLNKAFEFIIIPTISYFYRDFTCIELRDIMGFKSYGFCFKLFKWQMGFTIDIKPKTYKDNEC